MRKIMIVMLAALMLMTTGAYAASMSGTAKLLGGTGNLTVGAPSNNAVLGFGLDSSGDVEAAKVTWSPTSSGDYAIVVTIGGTNVTEIVTVPSAGSRTDILDLPSTLDPVGITSAKVVIAEQ